MDKAQKYTDKAIAQIDKLRNSYDAKPLLLSSFQALLMEHIVQCRLVTGNKEGAVQEIGNLCRLLQSNQLLLQRHRAQLHTMLGLYAMSMNCMDAAENQFNAALRVSNCLYDSIKYCFSSSSYLSDVKRARVVDVCKFESGYCLRSNQTRSRFRCSFG